MSDTPSVEPTPQPASRPSSARMSARTSAQPPDQAPSILSIVRRAVRRVLVVLAVAATLAAVVAAGWWGYRLYERQRILEAMVARLSADSRVAEVLVTQSRYNEETRRIETTIKFLEYDAAGRPLSPQYLTFQGNIIQFQSLVIRFDDAFVLAGDVLRGKSAYLFLRAFVLDKEMTQVFDLTPQQEIPMGYKLPGVTSEVERELWQEFWTYALDAGARQRAGIKNAQIEAPGSMFLPGTIYTLRIEHDGGLRIDTAPLPEILKGELRGDASTVHAPTTAPPASQEQPAVPGATIPPSKTPAPPPQTSER